MLLTETIGACTTFAGAWYIIADGCSIIRERSSALYITKICLLNNYELTELSTVDTAANKPTKIRRMYIVSRSPEWRRTVTDVTGISDDM